MRWSEHYRYFICSFEFESTEISSILRHDSTRSYAQWLVGNNSWKFYEYTVNISELIKSHEQEVSEKSLRYFVPAAFVPEPLDSKRLAFGSDGRAFIDWEEFCALLGSGDHSLPTPDHWQFWSFASNGIYMPQELLYYYVEQEGLGKILDSSSVPSRNQNPEYCCQSDSRIWCQSVNPRSVLLRHLYDLGLEDHEVTRRDLRHSLERYPCLLLDESKFLYYLFKLVSGKILDYSKDAAGGITLKKSSEVVSKVRKQKKYY